ncbi:hypothetical protein LCGC14_0978590 [marine sediment metagenome]|uniref:VOC domain-containing protein n=1 Tax=marine sediment metagenome TaxID=412755 RepID=A0A0F9QSS5_9ZZZZ
MIDHIAIAANSESDSDLFFIQLLGLEKIRIKNVSGDLMEKFFGMRKDHKFALYGNDKINFEVFITNDSSKAKDIFTHSCLYIENRDELVKTASSLGFKVIQVPRDDGNGYYLFIKDSFHNLYEIKEL